MKFITFIVSLFLLTSIYGLEPIQDNFRFVDRSYTFSETDGRGRKVEETKHFHKSARNGYIVERTLTVTDGKASGKEIAWWFSNEEKNNHFRVALMPNGNLSTIAMGRVSSGFNGVGMTENERGWHSAGQLNYNTSRNFKLRIAAGPLVGRGVVNESIFSRKTWSLSNMDRDAFNEMYRSDETRNFELSEDMKLFEPLIGSWEGIGPQGRNHVNFFAKISPNWVLEFWRIGEGEESFSGINIMGTDTLRGGAITLSSMGRGGFNKNRGRYEAANPGTAIQFQGNTRFVRSVSGNTMTVTRSRLDGIEYAEEAIYTLKSEE